jgi:hypothetical protein
MKVNKFPPGGSHLHVPYILLWKEIWGNKYCIVIDWVHAFRWVMVLFLKDWIFCSKESLFSFTNQNNLR